ncbi:hypothetical protein OAH75_00955 [Nitrosopumilus sp.]|nr:hypothetical protein [Nitrosopumilus sp.]MDB4839872.1 hypothetical protein [Nitrosopumilus sp.]
MMSSLENQKQMISNEYRTEMISESYNLITRLTNAEPDDYGNSKLFLHNSTQIEYTQLHQEQIDRFYNIVKKYGDSFFHLVQNLKYESVAKRIETDHIIGEVDVQMTRSIRQSGSKNVVCVSYTKNLFTPENVLLGAVILGIGTLAEKFKSRREKWDENRTDDKRVKLLEEIIGFSHFLKKDRFISKLIMYYYKNFNGIDLLLQKVQRRMSYGKIGPDYLNLIKFLQIWKNWDKISRDGSPLEIKLQNYLEKLNEPRLYELWLFYKIIDLYSKSKKMEQQSDKTVFSNGIYSIKEQWSKTIGWRKLNGSEVNRRPDILIRKNGKGVAIIDAKCMSGNKELEETSQGQMPDSKIVNQMIIAMDYGKEKTHVDLGIVLFADKDTYPVTIEKNDSKKKIHFRKMHPENDIELELEEMKKIIG